MARGRFISNEITKDKKINDLSDDTSRLAFTWLVTFADCEGRVDGDPAVLRSLLFPRRSDVTVQEMAAYIQEWAKAGLIAWYQSNGDWWIWLPNFERHQVGLRKDREAASRIPAPPDAVDLRTSSGVTPDKLPVNRIEVKGIKDKDAAAVFRHYENEIHALTPNTRDGLIDWMEEVPLDWIHNAIDESVKNNVRTYKYFEAILKTWKAKGRMTIKKEDAAPQAPKGYTSA